MADLQRKGDIDVKIADDTANLKANVVTIDSKNRLCVDALISDNQDSPRKGKYFSLLLKNGASHDMNVDGSSTPVTFSLAPPSGKKYIIARAIITIEDVSISHTKFGGIVSGLTNGMDFKVKEGGLAERDVSEHDIKTNADFYCIAYDVRIESSTTDIISTRLSFYKSGTYLEITDANSEYIKMIVNDDLTGLDNFCVIIQGYEVDE